jgi:lipase ATG15
MLPSSLLITLFLLPYVLSKLSFPSNQQHSELTLQFNPSSPHPLPPSPALKARPTIVYRPRSLEALHRTRLRSLYHAQSEVDPVIWDPVNIPGPDIEDLHTLAQLARMSANAYALPSYEDWFDVDHAWNLVRPSLLIEFPPFLSCSLTFVLYRVFHLVGKLRTASEVMFFHLLIIPPLCSP